MSNISRKHMPQVDTKNLSTAIKMAAKEVKVSKSKMAAGKLKKSQKELYTDKIHGIANTFKSAADLKPLIIAKDNYIVDGHHRWAAAIYKWGEKVKVPVIKIHLNGAEAIKLYKAIASKVNEMSYQDLKQVDQFADKKLNPIDVQLTGKHFYQRLKDPRNKKEITQAELIGFFKRLAKNKKDFIEFLDKYNQIVATDDKTNINIPFMKKANSAIAKTIMRKPDFKTPNKKLKIS